MPVAQLGLFEDYSHNSRICIPYRLLFSISFYACQVSYGTALHVVYPVGCHLQGVASSYNFKSRR
jgi:hypothetical protein